MLPGAHVAGSHWRRLRPEDPLNGSIWMESPRLARYGLELEEQGRRLVRVTTANGCFAGTEANGHSVRPVCDRGIWQAHKARAEVDTIAQADVKHWTCIRAGLDLWNSCISADYSLNSKSHESTPGLTTEIGSLVTKNRTERTDQADGEARSPNGDP